MNERQISSTLCIKIICPFIYTSQPFKNWSKWSSKSKWIFAGQCHTPWHVYYSGFEFKIRTNQQRQTAVSGDPDFSLTNFWSWHPCHIPQDEGHQLCQTLPQSSSWLPSACLQVLLTWAWSAPLIGGPS